MILDYNKFALALKRSGVKSVLELSRRSGLHRNTINHYLAGAGVYQKGFIIIADCLNTTPSGLISDKAPLQILNLEMAEVLDAIHSKFSDLTFVLFGSRARGMAKKYSDWDIGFLSAQTITHQTHLDVLKFADDLTEEKTESIDLVNLNEADNYFLKNNADDFVFLTGKICDWLRFKKRVKVL